MESFLQGRFRITETIQAFQNVAAQDRKYLAALRLDKDNRIGVHVRAARIRGPVVLTRFKSFGGRNRVPAKVMKRWEVRPLLRTPSLV